MTNREVIIPVDHEMLHIIYMCIIEHWRMPQYEENLSRNDFDLLKRLREKFLALRENPKTQEVHLSYEDIIALIKAYEIGFGELTRGGDDFHSIVGYNIERGEEVLKILKSYLSS